MCKYIFKSFMIKFIEKYFAYVLQQNYLYCNLRIEKMNNNNEKKIVLVTGGTGLVGSAIKYVVQNENNKDLNEEYIYLSSKDVDLTYNN